MTSINIDGLSNYELAEFIWDNSPELQDDDDYLGNNILFENLIYLTDRKELEEMYMFISNTS